MAKKQVQVQKGKANPRLTEIGRAAAKSVSTSRRALDIGGLDGRIKKE